MCKKLRFVVALILGAILLSFPTTPTLQAQTFSEWEEIGPTGVPYNSIVVQNPKDPEWVYFLGDDKLYYRTNSGEEWIHLRSGLSSSGKFLFNLKDENEIYLLEGNTVLKSSNKGVSWETFYTNEEMDIKYLDIENPESMLAGSRKLYKTDDKGETWQSIVGGLDYWEPGYDYRNAVGDGYEFFQNPYFPEVIIAQRTRNTGDLSYALGSYGTFDMGEHWDSLSNEVDWESLSPEFFIDKVLFHPEDSSIFYVEDPGYRTSKWRRTKDAGKTWVIISDELEGTLDQTEERFRKRLHSLMIDENNPDILYAKINRSDSLGEVYRSLDEGANWSLYKTFDRNGLNTSYSSILQKEEIQYQVQFPIGILYSNDSGQNWVVENEGINLSEVYYVLTGVENELYAGVSSRGIFSLNSEEQGWVNVFSSLDSRPNLIRISQSEPGTIFGRFCLGYNDCAFAKSSNFGNDWDFNKSDTLDYYYEFDIGSDGKTIFAKTRIGTTDNGSIVSGLGKSTDFGKTWEVSSLTGFEFENSYVNYIENINIDPVNEDRVYAIVSIRGEIQRNMIARTDNSGETWKIISDREKSGYEFYFLNPYESNTIYVMDGNMFYKSSDNGDNWVFIDSVGTMSSGRVSIYDLEIASNNPKVLYALSVNEGLIMSLDEGMNWSVVFENSEKWIRDISVKATDETTTALYAATNGQGVKRMIISGIPTSNETEEASPKTFSLSQNYPNPFNPSTRISYTLEQAGKVNLSVFNTIGQKVYTAVDEVRNAGSYSTTIDLRSLSSGVYFYTLTSGAFTETRKMVLLK